MKECISFRKLGSAILLAGLLLIVDTTAYAQSFPPCTTCHGTEGNIWDPDCLSCHAGTVPYLHQGGAVAAISFHNADGLICSKCHTMHYSEDGTTPPNADEGGPFEQLLLKSDITNLCLMCHQAPFNGSGAPIVLTDGSGNYPSISGGDFFYSESDQRKGHNPGGIIGLESLMPPGGPSPLTRFVCVSCHDPHGGSPANTYRLLKKKPEGWTISELEVDGVESHPGTSEGGEGSTAPGTASVPQYYYGFSDWCGACHSNPDDDGTGFHGSSKTDDDVSGDGINWFRHPTDKALESLASNYGTDYNWQYPVEVADDSGTVGPLDEVFCLSCHRSHGTPHFNSARWGNTQPSGEGTGCNKCHAKG